MDRVVDLGEALELEDGVPVDELDLAESLAELFENDPDFVEHADGCEECGETLDFAIEALVNEAQGVEDDEDDD